MNRVFLLRILPMFIGSVLAMGLSFAQVACGSDFENQGRSSVHRLFFVASGYVYTSTGDVDARMKAKEVALRFGLAQCRTYLNERGLGESDYQFKQLSGGHPVKVLASETLDASFQGEGLLGVRIIGEVQYEFSGDYQLLPRILHVELASDKARYRVGEHLYFGLRGNMNFYGSLLDLNPVGELIQLLPNGSRKQSAFDGQVSYLFPDRKAGDHFDLVVGPPLGREQIHIIVSDRRIPPILDESHIGEGFGVVERDFTWVNQQLAEQIVHLLQQQPVHETFSCLQVYENGVELTTSQSGSGQ